MGKGVGEQGVRESGVGGFPRKKTDLNEYRLNAIGLPGESQNSRQRLAVIVPNLPVSIQESKRSIFASLKINGAPNNTSLWRASITSNLHALKSPAPRLG